MAVHFRYKWVCGESDAWWTDVPAIGYCTSMGVVSEFRCIFRASFPLVVRYIFFWRFFFLSSWFNRDWNYHQVLSLLTFLVPLCCLFWVPTLTQTLFLFVGPCSTFRGQFNLPVAGSVMIVIIQRSENYWNNPLFVRLSILTAYVICSILLKRLTNFKEIWCWISRNTLRYTCE